MRERSTWKSGNRVATTSRRAEDIYSMNAEHPQPAADQYMAPDAGPDTWAETPADYEKSLIKQDYDAKGYVKRNEIGFADFQAPTFDRPRWGEGKYDNQKYAAQQKAVASHRLATTLLRTENKDLVRKVAVGFMALPDATINNALKAVADTQPSAMNDEARFKRAYACTKLAASMLTEDADEPTVERLARAIYQIDDPTLKKIIRVVASSHVAKSEGSASEGSKKAAPKDEGSAGKHEASKSEAKHATPKAHKAEKSDGKPAAKAAMEKEKSSSSGSGKMAEEMSVSEEEASGSVSETSAMLAEMMGDVSEESSGSGSGSVAPAPVAPPAPMAPAMAPGMPSTPPISFDEEGGQMHVQASALEALFSDDPEVKAHRDIMAAQREQLQRAAGYNVERTASTKGAKKLGAVRAAKEEAPESALTALWDRP